jgi:hypothetical protein
MIYTIYNTTTGQILRVVGTDDIQEQLGVGEAYFEGWCDDSKYYVKNGALVEIPPKPSQYSNFNYETKQWVENTSLLIVDVRAKRKLLLSGSDWTQLPDVPLTTKTTWATYRQALRDITTQSGYPFEIVWPTPPQ